MHGQTEIGSRPSSRLRSGSLAGLNQRAGRRFLLLGAIAGIALLDQGFKWWAWLNAPEVRINYGGDVLAPPVVGSWYAGAITGAVLDLLDAGLLITATWLFLRNRRSTLVLTSGAAVIGGWSSNLLDRLGMHYWTAPGSVRGVVDFIPIDHRYYNIADLFIISGTPLFILAVGVSALRRGVMKRPAIADDASTRTRRPRGIRAAVLAVTAPVALTAIVGVGAANFGGVTAPVAPTSIRNHPRLITHDGVALAIR
jgi:lipoprotein signal peptidase